MNRLIAQKIKDFSLDAYEPIVPRDLDLGNPLTPKAGNLVTVIVGMRRSGKTYRLFQEMKRVHASGVPWDRILYFNFEDDRFDPLVPTVGDEVLDTFYELNPEAYDGAYLFLDEIQEMRDWDKWARRIVDTRKATMYVTGSSSKLLSTDVASAFRGRAIDYELLPYSFREYVRVHEPGIDVDQAIMSSKDEARCRVLFDRYLRQGGFPAVQTEQGERLVMILQSYVKKVVAQDVIERHNLSNPQVVSLFSQRALATNGREFSVRKVENDFRSQGITTNRAALAEALRYFEDAFLLAAVRRFSRSFADNARSPSKVYAIDPGLAYANSLSPTQDVGQRLEDAVYLELRRRNAGMREGIISSLRTEGHGYEVDFVVGDALSQQGFSLYQVAVGISDAPVRRRELRALQEAMTERHLDEGFAIVLEGEAEEVSLEEGIVHIVPAWSWFLGTA